MKIKFALITVSAFLFITTIIPAVLTYPYKGTDSNYELINNEAPKPNSDPGEEIKQSHDLEVALYRSEQQSVDNIPLEDYVLGVVAAEMPANFEAEALKAQALAARTYIVKQLMVEEKVGLPEGADVTDTVMHQVYKSDEELEEQWGSSFASKYGKIKAAVTSTAGEILTYNNEPIAAQFFSTSNGYTENSEAYWSTPFDYLQSVPSPWDETAPKFYDEKTFHLSELEELLNITIKDQGKNGEALYTVDNYTPGKRIGEITIANKKLTGREVREKLQLQSTDFEMVREGDNIKVNTKGYGHGVGMSQYGANGLATEGKAYDQIVKHYYKGVAIQQIDLQTENLMVKK